MQEQARLESNNSGGVIVSEDLVLDCGYRCQGTNYFKRLTVVMSVARPYLPIGRNVEPAA